MKFSERKSGKHNFFKYALNDNFYDRLDPKKKKG